MKNTPSCIQDTFTTPLLTWYDLHGRKDLPWQEPYDPYRVWLSEIMLQQTQVKTVIPYFTRFITQLPTIEALAHAKEDEVLALWSGLGYYSRARYLQKAAQYVVAQFNGQLPDDPATLETLPGIGPSTAAAISSLAFERPYAILDGNVKRVLSRYFLIEGLPNNRSTQQQCSAYANTCVSNERPRAYSQAIMDLGATCCTPKNPTCTLCPLQNSCQAYLFNRVQDLPEKALKKSSPIKHAQFLLLHTFDKAIYLEKRPPKGIWGGLWCLPTLEKSASIRDYLKNELGLCAQDIYPFMTLKHIFTHFQLHIEAVRIPICEQDKILHPRPLNGAWFQLNELNKIGLAKPMTTLVERLIVMDERSVTP